MTAKKNEHTFSNLLINQAGQEEFSTQFYSITHVTVGVGRRGSIYDPGRGPNGPFGRWVYGLVDI